MDDGDDDSSADETEEHTELTTKKKGRGNLSETIGNFFTVTH